MPAWMMITMLILLGAGAATGLILKDALDGTTTIAVSQAILIDHTTFGPTDVHGDFDEAFVSVNDDGTEWAVHIESNNGDLIWYDLPIVNAGRENIVVQLSMWGQSSYTYDVTPLLYWSDASHTGVHSQDEALIYTTNTTLDRSDIIKATGYADFASFTSDHWFFDGSLTHGLTSYNDNAFTDWSGSVPEAILVDDGDGILDPGLLSANPDYLVTPGQAGLAELIGPYAVGSASAGKMFFTDNGAGTANKWDTGEDLYLNNDGDGYYTTSADTLVDADGYTTSAAGTAAAITVGDLLEDIDAGDNLYWDDADVSSTFTTGDSIWLDNGDNSYFNSNGESISDTSPDTDLTGPTEILDASLDIAFDGGAATTYYLENSGSITAATLSTVGVEDVVPSAIAVGDIVEIDAQGIWYIVSSKSADLDQRSTVTLIGDVVTSGDDVKAHDLIEQTPTMGAASGVFIAGAQTIDADGTETLTIDDGAGAAVDASDLDAGEVWAIDDNGVLGAETLFVVIDVDAGNPVTGVDVLGQASKGISDNYQFYAITVADSVNTADLDDHFLDSGADIATALDDAVTGSGSAAYTPTGFTGRFKIDSDDSTTSSAVVVTAGSTGTDVADDLKLGLIDGGLESGRDRIIRGSPTNDVTSGIEIVTGATSSCSFVDVSDDDEYDSGEDIYEEQTAGAGTYSTGTDTLIYDGGTTNVLAGSAAVSIDDDDNIMFRDTDHDGAYDWGVGTYEPLLYTGTADIETGGLLTSGVTVLARYGGDWPMLTDLDLWRLETHFNGANNHDYYFIDHDNDDRYDDGEAIIDQIGSTSTTSLDSGDFVVHQGLANLIELPVVISNLDLENCGPSLGCDLNREPVIIRKSTWKFMVPANSDLGVPLEVRITIALEDAATTCFFMIYGDIRPVNV